MPAPAARGSSARTRRPSPARRGVGLALAGGGPLGGIYEVGALLALADALPPAAMRMFHQFGPISSSTWVQHFLTDHPQTEDGWWLLVSQSRHIRNGFSAQSMYIWNSRRELVSVGGQGVAVYV